MHLKESAGNYEKSVGDGGCDQMVFFCLQRFRTELITTQFMNFLDLEKSLSDGLTKGQIQGKLLQCFLSLCPLAQVQLDYFFFFKIKILLHTFP